MVIHSQTVESRGWRRAYPLIFSRGPKIPIRGRKKTEEKNIARKGKKNQEKFQVVHIGSRKWVNFQGEGATPFLFSRYHPSPIFFRTLTAIACTFQFLQPGNTACIMHYRRAHNSTLF